MPRLSTVAKHLVTLVVVACVVFFFWKAFSHNWASIQAHDFQLNYALVVVSFVATVATTILYDYAWYFTTNSLAAARVVTFSQTFAIVNTSGFTKYVPGKVWSFALQMYWLTKLGISKSLILYVNMINMLVSMAASVVLGLCFLSFSSDRYPRSAVLALLAAFVLMDVCFLAFHSAMLNRAIAIFNKLFRKNVGYFDVSSGLLLRLHGIHLLAALLSALGGYALCVGLGYRIDFASVLLLMSALMLAEVVGFLAFMVPGGLGVREGAMYVILGGASIGSLSIIVPLATRTVSMVAELLLGVVSLKLMPRVVK